MELSRQPYDYICFELLRLRTRYDNEKDNAVKVRIAKRYREVRKEFDSRGSQWTPSEHELDRIIKAVEDFKKEDDWCVAQGGHWITTEGRHLCIGDDKDIDEAYTERNLISRYGTTKFKFYKGYKETADAITYEYNNLPRQAKERLVEIEVNDSLKGYRELSGGKIPPNYAEALKGYEDLPVGGYWERNKGKITIQASAYRDEDARIYAFRHEAGHAIYDAVNNNFTEKQKWNSIWEKDSVTDYGKVSADEGFAEAYNYYKSAPLTTKEEHPEVFKFMEEYLKNES